MPGLTRRRALQLGGLLGAAPLLASLTGCGGSNDQSSNSSGGTISGKLTFVFYGDASQQKAVVSEYSGFASEHPQLKFTAQGIAAANWAGFANTVSTRIAGGQAPDVIDIATEGLGIFRSKDLLVALDPYIEKSKKAIDDYYADIDPTYKKWSDKYGNPGGTTYYMPGGFNTVVLYCNTDVFQKAGVDLPGMGDWTWDDFTAAAKQIKAKTGAFILPFGSSQFTDIMPWLLTNGASTLDADWKKPVINSDAAIETAEFCKSMVDQGFSPKPGGNFDAAALLSQGKLAALAGGRWPTIDMQRLKIVDKVQLARMPKKVTNGGPIGWDAFPILKSSKNQDAAWAFIEYLTTKEAGISFAKAGGTNIPARQSIALSDTFLTGAPKNTELLYKVAADATPVPSPDRGAETQQAIEQMWLKILTGGISASQGLNQLADTLSGLL